MSVPETHARYLAWEGCSNVRDLGGLPTSSGALTRWRSIIRADYPGRLTPAGQEALIRYGVRAIVDLRLPNERGEAPHPFATSGPHGIVYTNVSFIDPDQATWEVETVALADDYKRMLRRFGHRVALIFQTIADLPEASTMIHCAAGKDRTGMIAALLLDLVGVPRQVIAEDYALSGHYLRPYYEKWLVEGPGERAEREAEIVRFAPRPEVMLEVLTHLDRRHSGTEGYLTEIGLTSNHIARLRRRLVLDEGF